MNRLALFLLAMLLGAPVGASAQSSIQANPLPSTPIVYVELAADARYEPVRAYGRVVLDARERPFSGAQVGLEDAKVLGRASGAEHQLSRVTANSAAEMIAAIQKAVDEGVNFFLVDAPAEVLRLVAPAVKGRDALLFNVSAPEAASRVAPVLMEAGPLAVVA